MLELATAKTLTFTTFTNVTPIKSRGMPYEIYPFNNFSKCNLTQKIHVFISNVRCEEQPVIQCVRYCCSRKNAEKRTNNYIIYHRLFRIPTLD